MNPRWMRQASRVWLRSTGYSPRATNGKSRFRHIGTVSPTFRCCHSGRTFTVPGMPSLSIRSVAIPAAAPIAHLHQPWPNFLWSRANRDGPVSIKDWLSLDVVAGHGPHHFGRALLRSVIAAPGKSIGTRPVSKPLPVPAGPYSAASLSPVRCDLLRGERYAIRANPQVQPTHARPYASVQKSRESGGHGFSRAVCVCPTSRL
jgi:hypothetical protein